MKVINASSLEDKLLHGVHFAGHPSDFTEKLNDTHDAATAANEMIVASSL